MLLVNNDHLSPLARRPMQCLMPVLFFSSEIGHVMQAFEGQSTSMLHGRASSIPGLMQTV